MGSSSHTVEGPRRQESEARVRERIRAHLEFLYGVQTAPEVARRIFRFIETHKQLRTRSVTGPYWTHEDVVLITYGNSIQSPTQPPLQTLRSFLIRHLPEEFSMVHIHHLTLRASWILSIKIYCPCFPQKR